MADIQRSSLRRKLHRVVRHACGIFPSTLRFAIYRTLVDCDPEPSNRLELKIAETQEELEACFRLLHDSYVGKGFMKPDASGMRVTPYHALPTTTTLCATFDGRVVGTISLIREGVFGFPLQSAFELENVRAKGGNVAQISALAIHPDFRETGGMLLFPLLKFIRHYAAEFSDTRHLVIAVNPRAIELHEALLFFERLQEKTVQSYEFANGAPAIGAELDMKYAAEIFKVNYRGRPLRKNLYKYFFQLKLPHIKMPARRYFTTNDPVMTPQLLDHFFNIKTQVFAGLDDRRKSLLWSIYGSLPEYSAVLPPQPDSAMESHPLRRHQRYSLRCPASVNFDQFDGGRTFVLNVIELSLHGFQAESKLDLPMQADIVGHAVVELGQDERSVINVRVVRRKETEQGVFFGFELDEPDTAWRRCVAALESGQTSRDLM